MFYAVLPIVLISAAIFFAIVFVVASGRQSEDWTREHERAELSRAPSRRDPRGATRLEPSASPPATTPDGWGLVRRTEAAAGAGGLIPIDSYVRRERCSRLKLDVLPGCRAVLIHNNRPTRVYREGVYWVGTQGVPLFGKLRLVVFEEAGQQVTLRLPGVPLRDGWHVDVTVAAWIFLRQAKDSTLREWVVRYRLDRMQGEPELLEPFRRRVRSALAQLTIHDALQKTYALEKLQRPAGGEGMFLEIDHIVSLDFSGLHVEQWRRLEAELAEAMRRLDAVLADARRRKIPPQLSTLDPGIGAKLREAIETVQLSKGQTVQEIATTLRTMIENIQSVDHVDQDNRRLSNDVMRLLNGLIPDFGFNEFLGIHGSDGFDDPAPRGRAAAAAHADAAETPLELADNPDPGWRLPDPLLTRPATARQVLSGLNLAGLIKGCAIVPDGAGRRELYVVADDPEYFDVRAARGRDRIADELDLDDMVVLPWSTDDQECLRRWCAEIASIEATDVDAHRAPDGAVVLSVYDENGRLVSRHGPRLTLFAAVVGALSGEPTVRIDAGGRS